MGNSKYTCTNPWILPKSSKTTSFSHAKNVEVNNVDYGQATFFVLRYFLKQTDADDYIDITDNDVISFRTGFNRYNSSNSTDLPSISLESDLIDV